MGSTPPPGQQALQLFADTYYALKIAHNTLKFTRILFETKWTRHVC